MNAPIQSPNGRTASSSMASTASSTHQSPANSMAPQPQPASVQEPTTDAFLRDFTLIAEAAKRAQMAVMMRDFESVGLS